MKIFITGATGFIGTNLVERLIAEKHDITINIRGEKRVVSENVKTYCLGRSNAQSDIEFFKNESFDGVIHLASLYLPAHTSDDVNNLIDSNVKFSSYVLECAAKAKINWFINTGTFWQHYNNNSYSPVNLYAATKQAFESIASFYIETKQIKFNTISLSDTFGPNDSRSKIFTFWEKIAKTGELLDMSPGQQVIDISYIDDVVNAFLLLAEHLKNGYPQITNGKTFAVKAKTRFTLRELSVVFEKVTGKKLNINWGGRSYRDREVMIPWENGNIIPGWKSKTDIKKGIKNLLNKNS